MCIECRTDELSEPIELAANHHRLIDGLVEEIDSEADRHELEELEARAFAKLLRILENRE